MMPSILIYKLGYFGGLVSILFGNVFQGKGIYDFFVGAGGWETSSLEWLALVGVFCLDGGVGADFVENARNPTETFGNSGMMLGLNRNFLYRINFFGSLKNILLKDREKGSTTDNISTIVSKTLSSTKSDQYQLHTTFN